MNRPRILLVDDDIEAGPVLATWIGRQGCDPTYVQGPVEADTALQTGSFELVLSDIQMPGNFRLEWIERLLRTECPPPVVLMTGSPELETAMRAANLPIAAYLLKPLDYNSLRQTITRLVAEHRRHRELMAVAREISQALEGTEPTGALADPSVADRLRAVARVFAAEGTRDFRSAAVGSADASWRLAITDTIAVLEKTKHSFRSRELGALRLRLERLMETPEPGRETRTAAVA